MATEASPPVKVCGRSFSAEDLETVRRIIADESAPCRAEIARRVCREFDWVNEGGDLKAMSCRVALLRLQERGFLQLPAPLRRNGNGKPYRPTQEIAPPPAGIVGSAGEVSGLRLRAVDSRTDSKLWNEAIARFHYLGYTPLSGAQQRYLVQSDDGILGAIGFGASAWKVAARDRWIGWTSQQRQSSLHRVVNNARFLLLPWVRVKNLASRVLSMSAQRLARDWQQRYGYQPVLLETFVEQPRFSGTCYRAANWIYVGDTQGRGKLDRYWERALPIKSVYLYPLVRDSRRKLCT
ncbi:MAG: DUF4338 domain-containing protein [bacterium]|nr:DUF4338 domain-containing protein [bacterium]